MESFPSRRRVLTIVKRIYMNTTRTASRRTAVNRRLEIFKDMEVILRSIYTIEGEGIRVKEFEVRISPESTVGTIFYKEQDFLKTDISLHPVAVSAESMTLRKGETVPRLCGGTDRRAVIRRP